ncbi:MAG TPA: PadR family transcriptional regulator [Deltaproteobacteria bacterium]|nr:PadR family transcriptional regulator [Deltaproteobacteria bacterium]
MDVRSIILGFLMDRRLTGYELRKAFSLSFSFFSGLSYGSIYPALKKMEKEGLITLEVQMQDGAPNRKVYTITEQGRREFMASIREPFPLERQRYGFIMHLFFFSHLAPQERIRLAREHLLSVQKVREELEHASPAIEKHADTFQLMCFRFGQRFFRDLERNVRDILGEIEKGVGNETDHDEGKGTEESP